MEYNYEQHIDSIGEIADRINLDKITILTGRNVIESTLIKSQSLLVEMLVGKA